MDSKVINKVMIKLMTMIICADHVASNVFNNIENTFFTMAMEPFTSPSNCYHQVKKCIALNQPIQCLDINVQYKYVSYSLLLEQSFTSSSSNTFSSLLDNDEQFINLTRKYLESWKGLQSIPQCWKALQTVLCALFYPRCDNEHSRIILPTYEMCRLIRSPCRVIDEHYQWPSFLNCENQTLFASKCATNSYTDLKFSSNININNRCPSRLVPTDDSNIFYHGFDGCSLHCINPIFSDSQYQDIYYLIKYGSMIAILSTLFASCSFMIDRACLKRRFYTSVIFYLNLCMLLSTTGWTIQLIKSRNEIVCRPDNTIRYAEPNKSDHFYCLLTFCLIYYFSTAASIWFVHLFRVFYKTFYGLSTGMKMNFNQFHFHMFAWSIPLIMTILIFVFAQIDADSLRGICLVGINKPVYRIVFVFIPQTLFIMAGSYHSFRTIYLLFKAKLKCEDHNSRRYKNISLALLRITFFTVSILIIYLVILATYFYELYSKQTYLKRFNDHLVCELNISSVLPLKLNRQSEHNDTISSMSNASITSINSANDNRFVSTCRKYESPNIWYIYLQLISIFMAPILTSSWIWTRATIATWRRFLKRQLCNPNKETNESLRLKPYELIANSYQKREQIQQGLYVPSLTSNHNDPVDMDINSAQSQSVSANFQQNFQTLLNRRHAICNSGNANANSGTNSANNTNTNDNSNMILTKQFADNDARSLYASQNLSISDLSQQLSYESLEYQQQQMAKYSHHHHRHPRRKKKKEREKQKLFSHRNNNHNESNTNSSKNTNVNQFKPNSTNDFFNLLFGPALASVQPQSIISGYNPYLWAMMQTSGHSMQPAALGAVASQPYMTTPSAKQIGKGGIRLQKDQFSSSFAFTHGMSDQTNDKIVNPMFEKRKLDSSISNMTVQPNSKSMMEAKMSNNLAISNQATTTNISPFNYMLNSMSTNHFPIDSSAALCPLNNVIGANPFLNPYSNNAAAAAAILAAAAAANAYAYTAYQPAASTQQPQPGPSTSTLAMNGNLHAAIPRYYNTQAAFMAYQQTRTDSQMKNLMQEHEKFKSLITAHQSDNESTTTETFLPINLSESESSRNGYYSDDVQHNQHQQFNSTRILVQERMKKVEHEIELQQQKEQNQNGAHNTDQL